jgi:hypothetical protein
MRRKRARVNEKLSGRDQKQSGQSKNIRFLCAGFLAICLHEGTTGVSRARAMSDPGNAAAEILAEIEAEIATAKIA